MTVMTKTVQVKGRPYAVGMWWQVPKKPAESPKAMLLAAQLRAKEFPHDGYNTAAIRRFQYGLGHIEGKRAKKLAALAAALNPPVLSFLGMFCLAGNKEDGLWWVCGIRQGIVAGDGDSVWDNYEDAHTASIKLLSSMRTCDQRETWDTPEASINAISLMLRPDARLEPLFPEPLVTKKRVLLAGGMLAAASVLFGLNHYRQQQEWETASQNRNARQAVQASRRAEIEATVDTFFSKPWENAPATASFISSCVQDSLDIPLVSRGWVADSVDCSASALTVTWAHQPGASYLVLPDNARLSKDPKKAVTTIARPKTDQTPREHKISAAELWPMSWTGQVLAQLGQDAGVLITTPWKKPEQKPVEGVTVIAPWSAAELEIAHVPVVLLLSGNFIDRLAEVPGLVVTHVSFNNTWNIKGAVYARP